MPGEYRDIEILRQGASAPVHRAFGWSVLAAMTAFLINNVLEVAYGFPSLAAIFGGASGAIVPALVYAVLIAGAIAYVLASSSRTLRMDAQSIHNFNIYLIRALFFSVFFVGVIDAAIALLRTENMLEPLFGQAAARNLGRANWVGPWIHMPLIVVGFIVALFTRTLGFTWLALLIVVAELLIVISRFVFSYEQALMGDLVRYWYAALFLFASAYTLFDEGHVRVDILYAAFSRRKKGTVNAIGTILLGMATCWVILAICFNGSQSIVNAPVTNFEVSQAGPFGMYAKYQMAAFIALFAITMMIEFVSYYLEAVADHRDEPGHRDIDSSAAH
ncbi:MAG: TRAP transporter small permease subunit [Nitratireductor sp.]|nr:TRAP transporter small permease subunit [Nitratireductor sp.]MCC0021196.1 TRAP transporter small permease subunit [Nitratireductor sp.]